MDVKLGSLVKINYNWEEIHIHSNTFYDMEEKMIGWGSSPDLYSTGIDYTPDDIDVTDDASFVWEIVD